MSNKFLFIGIKDKLSDEPIVPFGRFYENEELVKRDFRELFKDNAFRDDLNVYHIGFWLSDKQEFENVDNRLLFNIGDLYE